MDELIKMFEDMNKRIEALEEANKKQAITIDNLQKDLKNNYFTRDFFKRAWRGY
jgi:hypothetical protein